MKEHKPLSESEIRDKLEGNYDRTTFYRSFKTLEETKIIHKIVIDNHVVKYAINNYITKKPDHAHFYCQICNTVKCLENVPIQQLNLPLGYVCFETELIIKGTCNLCQKLT
jgi:Fur family ferric uptake transcriptional regulator